MFSDKFKESEKECIPKKIVRIGKRKFSCSLDRKGLSKRKRKYRLWKRYLETKDANVYQEYCRCRNQVRRITRKALKQQEKKVAKNAKSNSKLFWKFVNSKIKLRAAIPELYTTSTADHTKMAISDQEKADVLGKFFSSVFVREPEWTWVLNEDHQPEIREELEIQLSKESIANKLRQINTNKSPGPDLMHPRVMKELASVLVNPLYIIYDISIKLGKIPTAWKLATVSPIFKNNGNKHDASS